MLQAAAQGIPVMNRLGSSCIADEKNQCSDTSDICSEPSYSPAVAVDAGNADLQNYKHSKPLCFINYPGSANKLPQRKQQQTNGDSGDPKIPAAQVWVKRSEGQECGVSSLEPREKNKAWNSQCSWQVLANQGEPESQGSPIGKLAPLQYHLLTIIIPADTCYLC